MAADPNIKTSDKRVLGLKVTHLAWVLIAICWVIDTVIPLGVAAGVLYLIPAVIVIRSQNHRQILSVAIVCTVLTLLALLTSPEISSSQMWKVYLNRGLSIVVIWAIYFIGSQLESTRHEQLLQQQELEDSNARFELAVRGTSVGIWDWADLNIDHSYWSPKFYELLGYEPNEFEASISNFQSKILHPDDLQVAQEAGQLLLEKDEPFDIEYRLRTKAGQYRWFRATAVVSRDKNGLPTRMVGSIEDIHDKKTAEERAATFLSSMNHELRTPLNAIVGVSELLKDRDKHNADKLVALLNKTTTGLLTIVNDILDIQKIRAGEVIVEAVSTDLIQLVEDCVEIFRLAATEKNVRIELDIESGFPRTIVGDSTKLRQILTNLLSNALKFTHSGSIFVKLESSEKDYTLSVSDSGIGIPEDKLESVFERFKQADASTTRKYGGTGLGLSICKSFVELMNGKIEVRSQLNKGSTFSVTLPLVEGGEIPTGESLVNSLPPLKVLVAEDSEDNIFLLKAFMRRQPIELVVANNGQEALSIYESNRDFNGILLDMQMPIMDGYGAARAIRAFEKRNGLSPIPIIAFTASSMASEREHALTAGCDSFLAKPLEKEKLFLALTSLAG